MIWKYSKLLCMLFSLVKMFTVDYYFVLIKRCPKNRIFICRNTFWFIKIFKMQHWENHRDYFSRFSSRPLLLFLKSTQWFILGAHQALTTIFNLPFLLPAIQ